MPGEFRESSKPQLTYLDRLGEIQPGSDDAVVEALIKDIIDPLLAEPETTTDPNIPFTDPEALALMHLMLQIGALDREDPRKAAIVQRHFAPPLHMDNLGSRRDVLTGVFWASREAADLLQTAELSSPHELRRLKAIAFMPDYLLSLMQPPVYL